MIVAILSRTKVGKFSCNRRTYKKHHKIYEEFMKQGLITDDMNYISYKKNRGVPQFVVGAPNLETLMTELARIEGVPRKPCNLMYLKYHR